MNSRFIGREKELRDLNTRYITGKFEFAVIYGRRRVGKTTLINEFIKDKEAIHFTATESGSKQNLKDLSQSIYSLSSDFSDSSASFSTFKNALETVFKISKSRRLALVIDEYPYLADAHKAISSVLQVLIDQYKDVSKLFLILCGSSMSFMENQVMGYKSPLYGRRTCQYKILPFEFSEVQRFYSNFASEDLATAYGLSGGIPLYLSLLSDLRSIEDNIKDNFLTTNAYLFEEPNNLIKQECRNASGYNAIITAIADGASSSSQICTKTDLDSSLTASYLKKLIGLGLVKKEIPYGMKNYKKPIYLLNDSMFRFWYRFVPENLSYINRGLTDLAYKRIEPHISTFMGSVFEEICKQYLWKLLSEGKSAVDFTDIGRWWGTDPATKKQVEIDIMGTADKNTALFAECKWTNEKVDLNILETLIARSRLFKYSHVHYYLFAKRGFTDGCISKADALGNVTLVSYGDMLDVSDK